MSVFSTVYKDRIMNHAFRAVAFTPPSVVYVALHTSAAVPSEISGNGYARTPALFAPSANGTLGNDVAVTFPVATGLWAVTGFFSLFDALTGGDPIVIPQPLDSPEQGIAGRSIVFPINGLVVRLDP
jgi:hypothetical protein